MSPFHRSTSLSISAKCGCADNYLSHYDQNESLKCYQEFLRGPCKEGEQYISVEEEFTFEPKCMPTNCTDKNQIRYNNICLDIPTCGDNQGVRLPSKENPEAICVDGLGLRDSLISGKKSCKKGERKDSKGKCRKAIKPKKNKNKRSFLGVAGDIKKICCSS